MASGGIPMGGAIMACGARAGPPWLNSEKSEGAGVTIGGIGDSGAGDTIGGRGAGVTIGGIGGRGSLPIIPELPPRMAPSGWGKSWDGGEG